MASIMSLLNATSDDLHSSAVFHPRQLYVQHPTPPPSSTKMTMSSPKKTSLDFLLNHDSSVISQDTPFSPPSPPVVASTEEEAAAVLGSLRYSFSGPSTNGPPSPAQQQQQPNTPPTSPIQPTFHTPASPAPSSDAGSPPPPTTTTSRPTPTRIPKLYTCTAPSCTKTFRTSHSLRSHMRCHGDPQFPCLICGAPFRRKHDLHRHGRSLHNTGNPHQCQWCRKTFPRADALRRHINSRSPTHGCHVARVAAARSAVEEDDRVEREAYMEEEEEEEEMMVE